MKGTLVKSSSLLTAAVLIAAAWFGPVRSARADTVLYDSAGFIAGSQSFTQSFDIATPGTLTVSLSTIPWFDTLKDLTFFFTTADGLLGSSTSNGTESLHLSEGTQVFAHWFGEADGRFKLGVYGLKIEFSPDNVAPVPVPASLILLLSGIGGLFCWPRRLQTTSA